MGIEGTSFENDWDVWVYPPRVDATAPAGVTLVTDLDDGGGGAASATAAGSSSSSLPTA